MRNSSKKPPWFLRFVPGAILTLAGILLALLNGEIQSQRSNSPTNSIPQPQGPRIFSPNSWVAIDCDDCDTYYNYRKAKLAEARDKAIKAAKDKYSTAIANATQTYPLSNWKTQFSMAIWRRLTLNFCGRWKLNAVPTL